ncbi:MAG: sigma-54-dependent Fis family transcriptional regulator [Bdellovibrionales bacterium]|nr:sigma-54-dependent Fis family transcriptional regulator [Bdellovibrionales bacterium]
MNHPKSTNLSQYKLRLTAEDGQKEYILGDYNLFGSSPGCTHRVPSLDPKHFIIEKKGDYIELKDCNTKKLFLNKTHTMASILQNHDLLYTNDLEFQLLKDTPEKDTFLNSKNHKWQLILDKIPSIAKSDFTVTILGESGTGKELMARKVHQLSLRSEGPFISLNCSALSSNLIESELFGHKKGSFTDASCNRKGAFEAAKGGTLFLDEIGDLPIDLQPKLLRALENEEIRPVGSDEIKKTDVRIIVATHHNLHSKVIAGSFRQDLFFRLNVIEITMPTLKNRIEDFESIFYQFAKQFKIGFSHGAIQLLKTHNWPGNIRELKNVVQRAAALSSNKKISENDLSELISPLEQPNLVDSVNKLSGHKQKNLIKEIERQLIIEKLKEFKGSQRQTAEYLGIPKSTLHDRIRKYQINLESLI